MRVMIASCATTAAFWLIAIVPRKGGSYVSLPAVLTPLVASVPPILVLQGTLDPKTPYEGAQAQVAFLRQAGARNVTLAKIRQAPHFILWTAPACFEQSVHRFVAGQAVQECALNL